MFIMHISFKTLAFIAAAPLTLSAPSLLAQDTSRTEPTLIQSEVPEDVFARGRSREMLAVQILLDRTGHSPGVIDGFGGGNTSRALAAYEKASGLEVDGEVDDKTMSKLRSDVGSDPLFTTYTISESDLAGPFKPIPSGMEEMATRDRITYSGPTEYLAEKFHMDKDFLAAMNPDADFSTAGSKITVAQTGSETISETVARIEVDKANSEVRAYDEAGNLLTSFPATVGSSQFPSPSGTMNVAAIAMEANYTFDPSDQEWGGDEALTIPPGPNNPIGGVWIDLGKQGYGIHGTADPSSIAKTASHGCVRLTNWDARALAAAVDPGSTKVVFN